MNTYEIVWSENTPDGYRVFQKDVEAKDEIAAIRAVMVGTTSTTSKRTILSMYNIDCTAQGRNEDSKP